MKSDVALRIEEARKMLEDAERALEEGRFEECCVSSCYAIFHTVRALASAMDIGTKTVEDAVHVVCLHKDEIGLSREDCSKIYRAVDIKSEIDGGYMRRVTKEVAERSLEDAKVIFEKAVKFIEGA